MSYKKSNARTALEESYSNILSRLRAAQRSSVDASIREYVIAASIFLAYAEMENYVADLFTAFANSISYGSAKNSKLPGNLRSHLFLTKSNMRKIFGSFLAQNDEKELLANFSNAINGQHGDILSKMDHNVSCIGKEILTNNKYPSIDNLQKLFMRIGVNNIFDRLSRYLRRDSKYLLESLGSLRTQLAHNATLPGISPEDVRERLNDAKRLVNAIDRQMYGIVVRQASDADWKRYFAT